MNPRTQESTADTKAPLPDCALPQSTPQSVCSGAGIPGSKGRNYTPEEIRKRLLELGVRDATLDPTTPRAFELPASGISPQRQGYHSASRIPIILRFGSKTNIPHHENEYNDTTNPIDDEYGLNSSRPRSNFSGLSTTCRFLWQAPCTRTGSR